jgi:hypothetical protein
MKDTVKATREGRECSITLPIFVMLRLSPTGDRCIMLQPLLPFSRLMIGVLLVTDFVAGTAAAAPEQLTDLTGKAIVTVTLTGRDNFNSEYRYDLTVRNRSSDPLIADSLIVVLEKITNLAGEDREPLKSEPLLNRFEVVGQDGDTADGKPFFRVPVGASPDLSPLTDSLPFAIRIRNKDYVSLFTPSFRVFGKIRPAAEAKPSAGQTAPGLSSQDRTEKLIQLLLKKGIITEEERRAIQP